MLNLFVLRLRSAPQVQEARLRLASVAAPAALLEGGDPRSSVPVGLITLPEFPRMPAAVVCPKVLSPCPAPLGEATSASLESRLASALAVLRSYPRTHADRMASELLPTATWIPTPGRTVHRHSVGTGGVSSMFVNPRLQTNATPGGVHWSGARGHSR